MSDVSGRLIADKGQDAITIHLVDKKTGPAWIERQPAARKALLEAMRFDPKKGYSHAILPTGKESGFTVLAAVADVEKLSPWCLAKLGDVLPEGTYRLAEGSPGIAALGWLLAQHRFTRFKSKSVERGARNLIVADAARIDDIIRQAEATILVRDLIDTPPADMGPHELEEAVRDLAKAHHADIEVIKGDALDEGYPLIAAVGNAATRERRPRLIELHWGKADDPRIAIIGKGVCFDSGGLDIKPSAGMRLMKKDMGGAAHAIALAKLIMGARLPVRLHLLIPAVENSVDAASFRPSDVVKSRKGLTVEIDNTDAEGRLILADALTKAEEKEPELVIDYATLTGAARVALGPDLPATFCDDDALMDTLAACGREVDDPIWRLPLWDGYDDMLKSSVADLVNSAGSPFAGAITAGLFLRRFAPEGAQWIHFDTFGWRPSAKPGRPKGGEALGLRAAYHMLRTRYSQ